MMDTVPPIPWIQSPPGRRFRAKPVIVHAERWTGLISYEPGEVHLWADYHLRDSEDKCPACGHELCSHGWIGEVAEGGRLVCPGDKIITLEDGRKYPCKPDIFEATYESVEESMNASDLYTDPEEPTDDSGISPEHLEILNRACP